MKIWCLVNNIKNSHIKFKKPSDFCLIKIKGGREKVQIIKRVTCLQEVKDAIKKHHWGIRGNVKHTHEPFF